MRAPDLFGWLVIIGAIVFVARCMMEKRREKHHHGHGHPKPPKHHRCLELNPFSVVRPKDTSKGVFEMPELNIDNTDALLMGVAPTHAGKPVGVQSPTWTNNIPEAGSIETSTDGLRSYLVTADGYVGAYDVLLEVDVDLGEGVSTQGVRWTGNVGSAMADALNPSVSTVEKDARPPLG